MKIKSKLLVSLLSVSLIGASSVLTSCGDNKQGQEEIVRIDCGVKLSQSTLDLCVGDSYLLKAVISGGDKDTQLIFKSLAEDIVTISDTGLVNALKPGKTEIRAIYGSALAKCEVVVSLKDNVPSIILPNVISNSIKIDTTTRVNVSPLIDFNNKTYEFTPSYELSNEEVGKIENNTFVPLKNGKTFVTVSGTFFGKIAVPYTLEIEVQDNLIIFMKEKGGVESSNIHLFTHPGDGSTKFKTSFTPEFGVYLNSELINEPNLTISFDNSDEAFVYEEATHKVSSTYKTGEGYFVVSYKDENQNVFCKTFMAYNNKTILEYYGDVIETDSYGTTLPLEDIFKDFPNKDLLAATTVDQEESFEVRDGKVIGLPTKIIDGNVENQKFIVYNDCVGYIVDFKVYSKIIRTAEDLDVLNMKETTSIISGYYILANDIDGGNYGIKSHKRTAGAAYNFYPDNGFIGIFEGNGHTIKNITVGEGGIFGLISKGAVIRNLAIKDVDFRVVANEDDTPLLATYCNGCSLSNIYISNPFIRGANNASLVACNVMNNCSISHCLFELGEFEPKTYAGNGNYGVIGSMYGERNSLPNGSQYLFSNTYVVSKMPLVHNKQNKYICDTSDKFIGTDTEFEFKQILNIVHFADFEEMKNSGETFDSFSPRYWVVSPDGILSWKNL